ncbi:MAG: (Uracil-5)-methyltransferase [Gemmatimonadetes bacterium]|nr:(Uracil-5)-methyltransferase [Gemmatimonadota bacterium]
MARVEITGVAAGGDGVGRTESMVVFVPRTAIGDVAQVSLTKSKRFARGKLESLDIASPDRVEPPCVHYVADRCGGCQLQHIAYAAQLKAKGTIIADALRRIGRRDIGDVSVDASDAQWRYRRKLTLHLRRTNDGWIAGLHPYDDPVAVFDLRECPITEDRVLDVWREVRPAFDYLPREIALRVAVRLLDAGAALVVEGGQAWPTAERMFAAVPSLLELWWKPDGGRMRRVASRTIESQGGASFLQVNARVAEQLRNHVITRARAYSPVRVVDAYAGAGGTAMPLATRGTTVIAIEYDAEAVARFESRLRAPSRAIVGKVEDHILQALPADVVLLNPPRTGVDTRVTGALQNVSSPPRAIIYVSCDPATLARDLSRMPRYRVASVRAFDMFPQTAHVETVCELVPEVT